jgi:hypothetical protein
MSAVLSQTSLLVGSKPLERPFRLAFRITGKQVASGYVHCLRFYLRFNISFSLCRVVVTAISLIPTVLLRVLLAAAMVAFSAMLIPARVSLLLLLLSGLWRVMEMRIGTMVSTPYFIAFYLTRLNLLV